MEFSFKKDAQDTVEYIKSLFPHIKATIKETSPGHIWSVVYEDLTYLDLAQIQAIEGAVQIGWWSRLNLPYQRLTDEDVEALKSLLPELSKHGQKTIESVIQDRMKA